VPGGHPLLLAPVRNDLVSARVNRQDADHCRCRTGCPSPDQRSGLPHPLIPDLERLASQVAADAGFQVCGVQLLTHRIPMTLLVQLRLADGGDVSLDNCASFSGLLDDALEAAGLIEDAYVLEISSPGIAETLNDDRDFRSFRGFPVCVRYRDAKTGAEAEREGLLLERTDDSVQINVRGRTVRLPRADVIAVRLTTPTEG
jgi:ribosome maturation factor RimP